MRHFYKYEIVVHVHPFKKEEDSPPLTFTVHLFMTQGQRLMETFITVHLFMTQGQRLMETFLTVHLFMTQGQRLMETFCKFIIILINQQVNE